MPQTEIVLIQTDYNNAPSGTIASDEEVNAVSGFLQTQITDVVSSDNQIRTDFDNASGIFLKTGSNLGAGTGIYAQKSGQDLQFKSLVGASGIKITSDGTTVTINQGLTVATSEETWIAKLSFWRYLDDGSDQLSIETPYYEPDYDDTAWASGQGVLGYGETYPDMNTTLSYGADPNNKYRTYYFRKTFDVINASQITALTLSIIRDDGCVVYLNGSEVGRLGMAAGGYTYETFSSETLSGAQETTYYTLAADVSLLVEGENVIAVDVHQCNSTSSDLDFDLEAVATRESPAYTGENLGAGEGVYAQNDGTILQFKSLKSGANITVSSDDDEITITGAAVGETNTASNIGTGQGLYSTKVGTDLRFKSLFPGSGIQIVASGNSLVLNATGSSSSDIETDFNNASGVWTAADQANASNISSLQTDFTNSSGVFRSDIVNVVNDAENIRVDFDNASGVWTSNISSVTTTANNVREDFDNASGIWVKSASNIGTGQGVFSSKISYDLQFKKLYAGENMEVVASGNSIVFNSTAEGEAVPSAIDDLTDVTITAPSAGQYLRKGTGDWVNLAIQAADLPSAIDATKIADGSVTNTEFQYIGGVTSDVQTQINGKSATGHTHTAANVSDFSEAVDDRVDSLIIDSSSLLWTYNDGANTLSAAVSSGNFVLKHDSFIPTNDNIQHLGSSAKKFLSLHVSSGKFYSGVSINDLLHIDSADMVAQANTYNLGKSTKPFGSMFAISGSFSNGAKLAQVIYDAARITPIVTNVTDLGRSTKTFANAYIGNVIATSGRFTNGVQADKVHILDNTIRTTGRDAMGFNAFSPRKHFHFATATGDTKVIIEADPNNTGGENQDPYLILAQDGVGVSGWMGLEGTAGRTFTNSLANAFYLCTTKSVYGEFPWIQFATYGAARMTIDGTGQVGIGTTAPTGNLHIASTTDVTLWLQADTDNAGSEEDNPLLKMTQDGGNYGFNIGMIGSAGQIMTSSLQNAGFVTTVNNSALQFGTSNAARVTIDSDETKVGIGTTAPVNTLDVEGAVAIGATYSGTSAAPANGLIVQGKVGIGVIAPSSTLDVEGNVAIGATYSGTTAAPANGLLVEGQVGIGTTTPASTLDVAGGITIGSTYAGTDVAPDNGLIVEGIVGINTNSPNIDNKLTVFGTGIMAGQVATVSQVGGAQLKITTIDGSAIKIECHPNSSIGAEVAGYKCRSASNTAATIVKDGDDVLVLSGYAADGDDLSTRNAQIKFQIDGTPGANDMPGRIVFSTTPDGSNALAERMRIDNSGDLTFSPRANGVQWQILSKTTALTLSGATTDWVAAIPAGSMVLGLVGRVLVAPVGATTFSIGDTTTANVYAANAAYPLNDTFTSYADGGTNRVSPLIYNTATSIRVTAGGGGSFSAGQLRLTLYYVNLIAPTS